MANQYLNVQNGSGEDVTSVTIPNFAVPSITDGILVIEAGTELDAAIPNVSSVTFGGNACSFIGRSSAGTSFRNGIEKWYYLLGDTSPTGDIVVTLAAQVWSLYVKAYVVTELKQQAPEAIETAGTNSATSISDSITTLTDNAVVLSASCNGADGAMSVTGTGHTLISTTSAISLGVLAGRVETTSTGAYTLGASGSSSRWVQVLAAFEIAGADINLVVADGSHGHSADNLALTQNIALTVAESSHSHSADSPTLTQVHALSVNAAGHGHAADNLDLVENKTLVVADSSHAHSADNLETTVSLAITISDASHAHTADNQAISQVHVLAGLDTVHIHGADNVTLELPTVDLVIGDTAHAHSAGSVVIAQVHALSLDSADHVQLAEVLDLIQNTEIVIAEADHALSSDNLDLDQNAVLGTQDSTHSLINDAIAFSQVHNLAVLDSLHGFDDDFVQLASTVNQWNFYPPDAENWSDQARDNNSWVDQARNANNWTEE